VIEWATDVLGEGWQSATITLGDDGTGTGDSMVATLVRAAPGQPAEDDLPADGAGRRAVLYVHGYNDYFFQTHLADAWADHGYTFYALDLRRCGRSIRPGQTPHFTTDLVEYATELSAAARLITGELGHDGLVVNAHSTGGLVACLWLAQAEPGVVIDALVLNSPWLDLNAGWFHRVVATRLLDRVPVDPMQIVEDAPSPYSWHLHADHGGLWRYDLTLKPPAGFPVRAGWLRAVRRGQALLAAGLDLPAPVLVCTAASSGPNTWENDRIGSEDTILDVAQIAARAPRLGLDVTLVQIAGGIHDLALSARTPREEYLDVVFDWLARHGPSDHDPVPAPPTSQTTSERPAPSTPRL